MGSGIRRVDALLADYASYHRARGNLICHAFGITLILFGSIAMLRTLRLPALPTVTAAEILIGATLLFYLTLDAALALVMLVELALLDVAAAALADWRVGLAAFLLGWVFQGVGHARFERNSPAFFKNLAHLLIGPLFLANELLHIRRIESLTH